MKIKSLTNFLETIAPSTYQESYDNAGLITGNPEMDITGVMVCLDSTEAVLDEAIEKGCNVVVAHHPIVFKGLKKITGRNYVERVIIKAIKNDIAIYAIHTNLDNMYYQGVNTRIAEKLGLLQTRVLAPKKALKKLFTFVPTSHSETLRQALFQAGAGLTGSFEHLSYASLGVGTLHGKGGAEVKLELLFPEGKEKQIIRALKDNHPSDDVPYDIMSVENVNTDIGSGMIGQLPEPMDELSFLKNMKKKMKASCVRHTRLLDKPISKVAVCGGAGGFLLSAAMSQQADVFITADYKYHEFFDADGQIIIADIGHYESEQYTINLLQEIISQKFSTFAAYLTAVNTNPINYL